MSTNTKIPGAGCHHVAIAARDFDRSVNFYQQVLGMTPALAWGKAPDRAIMLDMGDGARVEIFERPNHPTITQEAPILHFAIATSDTDAATKLVRDAGMEITMEPKDVDIQSTTGPTPVRISFFKGPDGEIVEFFQTK